MHSIASVDLRVSDIPSAEASLSDLIKFAHTFDAYTHWGGFERCAEIANAKDLSSLDHARTCLFFEARRWRHFGSNPDEQAQAYWRQVVAAIRTFASNK